MKGILRIILVFGLALGLLVSSKAALSADTTHYIGLLDVSDIRDVWGWHKDKINFDDFEHDASVGLSYRYEVISKPGFRFDAGL